MLHHTETFRMNVPFHVCGNSLRRITLWAWWSGTSAFQLSVFKCVCKSRQQKCSKKKEVLKDKSLFLMTGAQWDMWERSSLIGNKQTNKQKSNNKALLISRRGRERRHCKQIPHNCFVSSVSNESAPIQTWSLTSIRLATSGNEMPDLFVYAHG